MSALIKEVVKKTIAENKVTIFSKSYCPFCLGAKDIFDDLNVNYKALELDERPDGPEIQHALLELTQQRTVPNIFVNQVHVGGSDDLKKALASGKLATLLKEAGLKSNL
ncbi:glutaredoxin [Gongronella butleri]|nr:glutaredoxin [Gongronella butleri]